MEKGTGKKYGGVAWETFIMKLRMRIQSDFI